MLQIHLLHLFVLTYAAYVSELVDKHGGFTRQPTTNCPTVKVDTWTADALDRLGFAISSSDQYTRICQWQPGPVSLSIESPSVADNTHTGKYAFRLGFCASLRA